MKKKIILLFTFILILPLTGCFKRDSFEDINIYTTIYPFEYIINRLYGNHSTVHSIYPDGVNIHDYTLTDKQIKDYSKSDLFIFNGIEKESDYVIEMLNHNQKMKIIDASLSMEYNYGLEELWLDPSNFLKIAQNIRSGFKEYLNNHYLKNEIDENYEKLKIEISALDAKFNLMTESSSQKTIVVGNDVFQYLSKYNIDVISLQEDETLTEKTIATVKELIQNKKISYIFLKQKDEVNNTIKSLIEGTDVQIAYLHTLDNIGESERNNKKDYINIMNDNIDLLKNELYD